jgi:hypothetical protein
MRKVNWTYCTTVVIVYMFMLGAATISFTHIVDISQTLGLGWEAYTVPFFIDGLAVLGKIGRSKRFAASTRRAGLKVMASAGIVSLAANIAAGNNVGQQIYGALVVAGFIAAEWYSAKLEAAPEPAPTVVDEETRAKRSAAARKAAATRKANKARAQRKQRTPRAPRAPRPAEIAELEVSYAMADAPVSGA